MAEYSSADGVAMELDVMLASLASLPKLGYNVTIDEVGDNTSDNVMESPTMMSIHSADDHAAYPNSNAGPTISCYPEDAIVATAAARQDLRQSLPVQSSCPATDGAYTTEPCAKSSLPRTRRGMSLKAGPAGRVSHSNVERRYRHNLNRQIEKLAQVMGEEVVEECTGLRGKWPSKPLVLAAAVMHIERLEFQRQVNRNTMIALQQQLQALRSWHSCEQYSAGNTGAVPKSTT